MTTPSSSELLGSPAIHDPMVAVEFSEITSRIEALNSLGNESSEELHVLRSSIDCLTPAELLGPDMFAVSQEQHARFLADPSLKQQVMQDFEACCFGCLQDTCVSTEQWRQAFHGVALRSLPSRVRREFARSLDCQSRATPAVIDRLIDCLDDGESDELRETVLGSLGMLGSLACRSVPRAMEIAVASCDEGLVAEALSAIAKCLTPDMHNAFTFLIQYSDYRRVGEGLADKVLYSLYWCRNFQQELVELLVPLIERSDVPVSLRERALFALPSESQFLKPFAERLARLFAADTTPLSIRQSLCHKLYDVADIGNGVSEAYSVVGTDSSLPRELRFAAYCSHRKMSATAMANVAPLAIAQFELDVPPSVKDILFRLTAATLQTAGPLLSDPNEDAFLRTIVPAVYYCRFSASPPYSSVATPAFSKRYWPDYVAAALCSPWLERALRGIICQRFRSVRDPDLNDLLQSLKVYLIELLHDPKFPLRPDPAELISFAKVVVRRIDSRARHRLPKDHGSKRGERHGQIYVGSFNPEWDVVSAESSPMDIVEDQEVSDLLYSLLDSHLSEFERECLLAIRFDGMSLNEAAEQLGVSSHKVGRQAKQAQEKLRRAMSRLIV